MKHWDRELNTDGLLCPLPVLKARKALKEMKTGDILKLHVDDPAGIIDVPYYCNETNNKIIETTINHQNQIYLIIKG
tara:strand:+ start:2037 stop:2267 length:231 start_codon:yes stop_codon:yes gene_type:complete